MRSLDRSFGRLLDLEVVHSAALLQFGHKPEGLFPATGPGLRGKGRIAVLWENARIFPAALGRHFQFAVPVPNGPVSQRRKPTLQFAFFGSNSLRQYFGDLFVEQPKIVCRDGFKISLLHGEFASVSRLPAFAPCECQQAYSAEN